MGNGTTQAEILLIQTVGPITILLRNIAIPGIFHIFLCNFQTSIWLTFVLDVLLVVLPIILILTLLSDYIPLVLLTEVIMLLIFAIILICDHCFIKRRKRTYCDLFNQINDDHYSPTKFITYMRMYGFIATAIAILAVDFDVFPNRFAKTSTFGRSLMDLGTATFVYCFAVVDVFRHYPGRVKNPIQKQRYCFLKASSSIVLIALGITRTVLLNYMNYHYQINEYGVHWNFFITLGMLRLIVDFLGRRYHSLLGIVIAITYQYFLTKQNLQEYLISSKTERKDFISKNREGIFSLYGYLSIYYFASTIASFLFTGISHQDYCDSHINFNKTEKRKRIKIWFKRLLQLLLLTLIIFIAQQFAVVLVGPPSRRIANVPYILEMLIFHTAYLCGYLFIQLLQAWASQTPKFRNNLNKNASIEKEIEEKVPSDDEREALEPSVMDSVNQYGLLFFLLANILTVRY
ncbi:GPI-anchored wall transfer protein [Dirofilaria immitis]